jgi:hypothetical protein
MRERAAVERALLWATVLAPALVILPRSGASFGTHGALKLAALAPLAAGWAFVSRRQARPRGAELALSLACLAAFAGALATRQPLAGAAPALLGAACLWLVARGVRARFAERWGEVEWAVAVGAGSVAAIAFGEMLGLELPWAAVQRPQSTLANRNYVAGYLAIALPTACALALRRPRPGLAIVALSSVVLVASRCRSAYLALLVAAALSAAWGGARLLRTERGARGLAPELRRRLALLAPELRRRLALLAGVLATGAALGALVPWPGVHFSQSVGQTAGRLLEHDQGSGRVRVEQHRLGLAVLQASPSRWLLGAGPGAWEDAASQQSHAVGGRHAAMVVGPNTPNSDALRVLVEQGLVGLACLAAAFFLTLRGTLRRALGEGPLAPAVAIAAGLGAALTHGLFDAPLFRAECVALVGVLVGASAGAGEAQTAGTPGDASEHVRGERAPVARIFDFVPRFAALFVPLVGVACGVAAVARAASFVASASAPMASPLWEARQELAARLFPRADTFEQLAVVRARRGRCDEAEAALGRLNEQRPHHWGARVEVWACYAKAERRQDARRVWGEARGVDEHLADLVNALKAERAARAGL